MTPEPFCEARSNALSLAPTARKRVERSRAASKA